jgi:hypothetical protein
VNAEESPQFALRAPGEAIVSEWDDPLDFSGFHTSLVAGVDRLDLQPDGITAAPPSLRRTHARTKRSCSKHWRRRGGAHCRSTRATPDSAV